MDTRSFSVAGFISATYADPLAVQILEGTVHNGEHLLVDAIGNHLTFTAGEALEV